MTGGRVSDGGGPSRAGGVEVGIGPGVHGGGESTGGGPLPRRRGPADGGDGDGVGSGEGSLRPLRAGGEGDVRAVRAGGGAVCGSRVAVAEPPATVSAGGADPSPHGGVLVGEVQQGVGGRRGEGLRGGAVPSHGADREDRQGIRGTGIRGTGGEAARERLTPA